MTKKGQNIAEIFQKIETSALLPKPVQKMDSRLVWCTGSLKYPIDFMEDCAKIFKVTIEQNDAWYRFPKENVAIFFDRKSQIMYINEAALHFIERNKSKITLCLK